MQQKHTDDRFENWIMKIEIMNKIKFAYRY